MRGDKFAQRLQHIEQRVVGVRVIDEHLELPFRRHRFEPPRHLRRFRQAEDRFAQADAETAGGGERGQRIRDIESPDQRDRTR